MNKSKLPLSASPEKICILRLSALGDVTHVIPALRAIQKQWPKAEITWICGTFEYKLLRLIDGVHFICFDKKAGMKEYFKLWKSLKQQKFDVLLLMQVAARANIASLGIRAKIKLGWDKQRSRDLHQLCIDQCIEESQQQHQVQGFLSFPRALGVKVEEPEWNMPVTDLALEFALKYIDIDKPLMIISACSSHKLRNWSAKRYAKLADYAVLKYGMQVVLSGGPGAIELDMASDIIQEMQNSALNLVGKDTLEQLTGLLSKATVVVSPDSGPAHLANAMGVPVIGLYACTWSLRSGPYNSLEYCVDQFEVAADQYLKQPASKLRWGKKIEQPGVMDLISVEMVCEKLDKLMSDLC